MWIFELIVLSYFVYVVLYTTLFSVSGFFYREPAKNTSQSYSRFCVLIPCYKEDSVILEVAQRALNQSYPHNQYTVVIIADSLQPATLVKLRELPIQVVEVKFESSTKVKSLNYTLQNLENNYDYAVILDADNVMDYDFLKTINSIASPSAKAIQGQRKPKNKNNSLAVLDGISEAINNHIFRQGTVSLGLSSSISGSGVAFDFITLKEKLSSMSSVGGFDRELEVVLLLDGIKVAYLKSAIVYDEKVSQNKAFQNQRKRWISSQYFYLRKYFISGTVALFKGDFTFFNSAVLRNIQLPRLINIGLLTTLTVLSIVIAPYLHYSYTLWLGLFTLNTLSIIMAIPREFWSRRLVTSIFSLPLIFIQMFLLLFRLKGANKKFIHTPHGAHTPKQES